MLAHARCDKSKHSKAAARLSIAVARRLQARAALPEAGRPRRTAPRPVTTWRPIDLATWTKSASRQVDKSKGRRAGTGHAGARPSRTAAGRQHDRIDRNDRRSGPEVAKRGGAVSVESVARSSRSKGRRAGTGRAGARPSRTAAGRQHDRIDRIDRRSGPNAARGAGVRDPAGKGRRRRPCAPACPDSSRRRPPPSSPAHAGRTGPDCA